MINAPQAVKDALTSGNFTYANLITINLGDAYGTGVDNILYHTDYHTSITLGDNTYTPDHNIVEIDGISRKGSTGSDKLELSFSVTDPDVIAAIKTQRYINKASSINRCIMQDGNVLEGFLIPVRTAWGLSHSFSGGADDRVVTLVIDSVLGALTSDNGWYAIDSSHRQRYPNDLIMRHSPTVFTDDQKDKYTANFNGTIDQEIKPPALPKIYGYKNAELVPILLLKHRKSHTFYRHYFTTFIYAISIGECEFVDVTNIRLDDDSSNIRVVTDTSRDVGGWSCRVRTPTDASTSSLLDEENNGDLSFWFEGMDLAEKNRLVGMRGEGLTLLFVKNRNRDDWLTTPPKITVPVRGAKVYDPRLGAISAATTVFSRNPALQYADYLRSVEYGAGQRNIPVTNANIIELANHFDQIPDSIGNAGINSILIDVQIDTGKPIVDNMNVWMEGTRLYTSDYYGQFNVRVETKSASVWTFNEHDLEGETQYDSGDFTERLNSLTYTVKQLVQDQSEGSQVGLGFGDGFDFYDDFNLQYGDLVEVDVEATFPESGSAIHTAWLAEDGGIPNFSSESLEYVSELDQALYWTMVDARISRQPRTMELPVGAIGWLFETGDVIQHTSEIMAETNSYWRVSEVSEGDGETVLNCVAYDDAFYVPDPDVVPTPVAFAKPPIILTIPTITGFELYQENGDFYLQWDELEDSRVLWYAVEIYDTEGVLVQSNQRVSQSPLLITNPSIQSYTANIVPYGINLEGEITQLTLNIVAPVTPTSAPSVTSKAGFITVSPPALASNKFTYEWEWSTNEDATIVAGGTTIAKTISGVIPDVEYVIGYRAVTSNGVGDWLYVNVNGVEKTTYIWYVYADNNVGAGISLDPSDKTYFGILGNRPVPTPDISDPTIFDYYIQPVSGVTIGDGITAGLSSDSRTISTNSAGEGGDYSDVSSKLTILVGKVDDTSSYTLSTSTSSGVFGSLSGSTFTVTDLTADSGTVTFTATRTDYPTLTKVFSLSKAKDGVTGADGASVAYLQQFETSASQAELVVHNGTKVLSTDNFSGTYAYYLTGAVGNVANSVGNGTSFYLTIPEDLALSFVGNTVVFSIYAKAPTTNPSAEFAIAYSTNEVGNSGFTNHTPTSDWNKYSLEYIVPEPATGGADYIIIVADTSSSGKSLLIDSVRVEIKGVDGLSAFEIWSAANGNQNEAAFLESLNVTDGDDGNTWYSETGDSANWVIGVVGDFILSDGSNVYKKTDVSPHTWAFVKNLIGETGETGPDGVTADAIVGIEGQRWGFGNNTLQDFITVGCSGVVVQKGVIKLTTTNTDPNLTSPSGLTIKGNESYAIRVRIRTTSVTHTTSFEIYYSNDDHSFTGANYLSTPVTYVQNEWKYLVFDMRDVGDWYDPQTINRLRFDFSQLSGKNYEIDGIVVGFFGSADETNYDDARIGNNKISIDDLVAADFSRPFTRKPNQWEEVADATEGRFSYKVDGGTTVVNNVFSSAERTKLNRLRSGQNPSDASKSILNDGIIANDLIGSGKTFTVRPNSTLPSNISTFGKIRFNIDGVDADYEAVSTSEVDTRANGRIGALRPDSAYKNTNTTKANVGLSAVDNKSALTLKSEAIAAAKLDSLLVNNSGAGFNFFNGKYQNPDLRIITYSKANIGGTLVSGSNFNQPSGGTVYVIQATNSDAYVYLGTNSSDYNTPILPNRKWLVSMWVYTQTASSTNKTVQMYMRFSNGAHIGMTSTTSTTVNQWKRVSGIIDATGNASDSCVVRIDNDGGSGTTVVYDQIMIELYVEGTVEPSQYSPPINEYKIKDQRTIPMVNSAGASAAMNINPLSAADVGSYTTITIAAHTVQMASGLVSYNSGSISYKPFATAYYIYCDDYDVIGGAVTYIATTTVQNLTADSARRYIGRIVTPSDGGGTTIPPDFECLDENMWLTPTLQIKDACVGDVIDVFDTGYTSLVAGAIQALKKGEEDCVQIITESDCEVICTIETPITRVDGSNFLAHNALGEYVYVNDEGVQRWEQVTKVTSVGSRKIVKISVGNISFSAGTYAHKQIVTHNQLKP